MKHRALILCVHFQRHLDRYRERLERQGVEIEAPPVVQRMTKRELLPMIGGFDAVLAGDDEITADVLQAAGRLKVIVKWGIGVDAIDLDCARRLGIPVVNTPGAFADEVADVVIGYLILLARSLHLLDREVRQGRWIKPEGRSLRDRHLGVIGVGSIGRALVERALVLGMEVMGHDVEPVPEEFLERTGLRMVDLPEILATSDFLSLNCPLTAKTHHLLDGAAFSRMRHGIRLINTGRGPLIDESALVSALREGKVAGAALDVFEQEPLPEDSPLRAFDNCIFGTHNASNTLDAVLRTNERALDALLRGLEVARA